MAVKDYINELVLGKVENYERGEILPLPGTWYTEAELLAIAYGICRELGLLGSLPQITFNETVPTYCNQYGNLVNVNLRGTGEHAPSALAHELRHVQQIRQGRLRTQFDCHYWDNSYFTDASSVVWGIIPHHELPWEQDAIQYEREWSRRNGYPWMHRPEMDGPEENK